MKVLFVNTSDTSGGAARAANRIRKGVQSQGMQAQMFVKSKQSDDNTVIELGDFIPENVISKLFDWCASKIKNKWQHHKWRPYKDRENLFMSDLRSTSIHGAFRELDYDILHLHWINLRFIDINELKHVNKPIVWTLHDSWPFCGICHYFMECEQYKSHCGNCHYLHSGKLKDLSYEVFDDKLDAYSGLNLHIVTPSHWLADCARKSALFKQFPVSVIPNCLDTDVFSPKNRKEAIDRWLPKQEKRCSKSFILYGAMNAATDKIKGFSNLLSALHILEKNYDCSNLELLVFGADKPIDVLETGIPVSYLGCVNNDEDLALLYSLSDVTVVPSLTENLSCAIMESLSCGTPVCCFNIGGNGDMVEHKNNGYLAKEFDERDLAKGIMWCLGNNKDGHLGQNAREKVLENFTIDDVGRQYVELYKSIMEFA